MIRVPHINQINQWDFKRKSKRWWRKIHQFHVPMLPKPKQHDTESSTTTRSNKYNDLMQDWHRSVLLLKMSQRISWTVDWKFHLASRYSSMQMKTSAEKEDAHQWRRKCLERISKMRRIENGHAPSIVRMSTCPWCSIAWAKIDHHLARAGKKAPHVLKRHRIEVASPARGSFRQIRVSLDSH